MVRRVSKEDAIARLQRQVDAIPGLKRLPRGDPAFKKWHRDAQVAITHTFGSNGRHLEDFDSIHYSLMAFSSATPDSAFDEAYREGLDRARAVLASLIDEIREYWDDAEATPAGKDALSSLLRICSRVHLIARQLRARHAGRPTLEVEDEYDLQDLVHALLMLEFDDVRREEWSPSYAGAGSRLDFLLKDHRAVLEVKKTRKGLDAKQIGEELLIDIQRYRVHPDCKTLVCLVYDSEGRIANPRGLEKDLSGERNDIDVRVIIAPSGT